MNRIVVGVDGSEHSRHALQWAFSEGKLRNATVEVLHAWTNYTVYTPPGAVFDDREQLQKQASALLENEIQAALGDSPAPRIETVTAEGSPAECLINASNGADLVVVGSRGRGGFSGLLLGSVSQQVTHHAHCPIVIVK